jgi:hypothetical protein
LMREKTKLQVTKDYGIFEMHPMNRDLHEKPILLASMKANGFMPSSPIQCIRNGSGKLKVIRGHHRLDYARRLGLPVWYVIDASSVDIYDLEGDASSRWSLKDFMDSRAKAGDKDCAAVKAFQRKHQLTIGSAISLVGGAVDSTTASVAVKRGLFRAAPDSKFADSVVDIVDFFRESGVRFATSSAFVKAVGMLVRVPQFKPEVLTHRIKLWPAGIQKRSTVDQYLEELEALYNYGAKAGRLPLAFKAKELARKRAESFGGPERRAAGRARAHAVAKARREAGR